MGLGLGMPETLPTRKVLIRLTHLFHNSSFSLSLGLLQALAYYPPCDLRHAPTLLVSGSSFIAAAAAVLLL